MKEKIYLSSPHISDEGYELEYIKEAFATNWIAPLGPNVDEFEKEFAAKVGSKAAVALSSGTAAIHLALKAAGVGAGDIVFCQSLTFSASANPIIYQNATPVFIDSDYETWNMCPGALEEAFVKYRRAGRPPKAVIVVHLYGLAADLDPILELCHRYNVPLIEDAAESLGTLYQGKHTGYQKKHTGTLGDYGIFSFNGNKIITTSGGGMLISENEEKLAKVKFWATQAKDPARHYQHSELGFNYRLSNVSAGIGRGQLKVLDQRVAKKRYIFEYYKRELGELEGVQFMPAPANKWSERDPANEQNEFGLGQDGGKAVNDLWPANGQNELRSPNANLHRLPVPMPAGGWSEPSYWLTCITLDGPVRPLEIIEALEAENIESRPLWKPMHRQPFFEKYDYIGGNVSEELFENGVCLPSDTKMTDKDLERICEIIKRLWR